MKYQVIYRLSHPQSLPTTASATVDAHTHRELDAHLAALKAKWQAQGYTIQITRVVAREPYKQHFRRQRKGRQNSESLKRDT